MTWTLTLHCVTIGRIVVVANDYPEIEISIDYNNDDNDLSGKLCDKIKKRRMNLNKNQHNWFHTNTFVEVDDIGEYNKLAKPNSSPPIPIPKCKFIYGKTLN
jgi:hypothetical protein